MGVVLYEITMGVLDCWLGVIILIAAMVRKSTKIFWIGFVVEILLILGKILGGWDIEIIAGIVFSIIFSIIAYVVTTRD